MFLNLLSNAIKFSPSGGKICISAKEISSRVIIEIQDEGKGISDSVINSLDKNEAITSTMGTDGEVGTGLGLGLIKKYLSEMNGHFNISKNTIGTLVEINLDRG